MKGSKRDQFGVSLWVQKGPVRRVTVGSDEDVGYQKDSREGFQKGPVWHVTLGFDGDVWP